MPWTEITYREYERRGRRYASDLTDRELSLIEPLLPPLRRIGRPRHTDLRDVLEAILYMASTGCQRRFLPNDFPLSSTVQRYLNDWRDSGLLQTINDQLVMATRELEGRESSPSAGVSDSHMWMAPSSQGCRAVF
jgi:transposase